MFLNSNKFPYLIAIKENIDIISSEFYEALKNEEIRKILYQSEDNIDYYSAHWTRDNGFHPEQIGYDIREGDYSTLALYKKGFPIKTIEIEKYFPNTINLVKQIPNLHLLSIFRMAPNTKLLEHVHTRSHLIFHLLLNNLENGSCALTCGNETIYLTNKGDTALFNYSLPHSTFNNCSSERFNLVIDFEPPK